MEGKTGVGDHWIEKGENIDPFVIASTQRVRGNLKGKRLLRLCLAMTFSCLPQTSGLKRLRNCVSGKIINPPSPPFTKGGLGGLNIYLIFYQKNRSAPIYWGRTKSVGNKCRRYVCDFDRSFGEEYGTVSS